jgi:hypothetical protein
MGLLFTPSEKLIDLYLEAQALAAAAASRDEPGANLSGADTGDEGAEKKPRLAS